MIFIYFFCTKIAGTRHVLFVQLHSILKGARRFGFPTKTTPFASRACGPDCEPQRAFRGQPPQAALRPRSRLRATLGQDAPHGRGVKGSIRLAPDQTDRRLRLPRVFSASAEARQAASPNGLRFLPFIRFYHESGCQSEPGGNFPPGFDISVRIGKSNSISKNGWLYTKRSLEKFQ